MKRKKLLVMMMTAMMSFSFVPGNLAGAGTALAEEVNYTVSFNLNGGSWESDDESDYADGLECSAGGDVYLPSSYMVERTGYKLVGWTETLNGTEVLDSGYYYPTADVTLYAKWEKLLSVKYDLNGGKWTDSYYEDRYGEVRYVESGDSEYISGTYAAERTGYKLLGWTTVKDSATLVSSYSSYNITKDTVFYAKWEKLYTVKYDLDGGKWDDDYYKDGRTVEKNETVYLPSDYDAVKTGYELSGWTVKKGSGTVLTGDYKVTEDITLYAKWEKTYTVKFNVNGGKWSDNYYKNGIAVRKDEIVDLPGSGSIERKGCILKGWTVKKNSGTILNRDYTVTKNITLYAKWARAYTITFNAGQGYYNGNKKTKTYKIKYEAGKAIGYELTDSDNIPVNGKKSFAGWYKDKKLKTPAKKSDVIKKNTTYYAKWYTKSYKITVTNLKGASYHNKATDKYVSESESKAKSYSYYIAQGDPIGYIYAYKNGNEGFFYFDKACKEKPYYSDYIPVKNTTVYAKFINNITISWDANGGKGKYSGSPTGSVTSDKNLMCENLPEIERKGYYLIGWVDTANPKKVLPVSHVFKKDTTIKAKWGKAIRILFKANGGKFSDYYSYLYKTGVYMKAKTRIGDTIGYFDPPEKSGYIFEGWKSSVTGKVVKSIYNEKPKKATTYTAVWKKIKKVSNTVKIVLMGEAGSIYDYDKIDGGTYVAKKVLYVPKNTTYYDVSINSISHDEPSKRLGFVGWSLTKKGKVLSSKYKFTKSVTLYPVWDKRKTPIHVVLVANGGAINRYAQNRPHVYSLSSQDGYFILPASKEIEREGYKFAGWYTNYKCTKKVINPSKFKTSKTCYLYAKWKKK